MLRFIFGLFFMLAIASGSFAQQLFTTINDAITGASGNLTVTVAQTFTTTDGYVIGAGTKYIVTISSNGQFTITIPPTIGAAPFNAFYYADYVTSSTRVREQWALPVSAVPVNLAAVRVLWPQAPNNRIPATQIVPPPECTPIGASTSNLVLRYTTSPVGWICAPDNVGSVTMNLENPTPVDAGKFQWQPKNGLKLTSISCSVDSGTVSINLEVRSAAAPNSSGQQVLSTPLTCPSTTSSSTSFQTASVPGFSPVALIITASSGSPGVVRVYANYIVN